MFYLELTIKKGFLGFHNDRIIDFSFDIMYGKMGVSDSGVKS
jgi:hypothetical protein